MPCLNVRYLFLNYEGNLRNGWWMLLFFLVLGSLLVPSLIVAQKSSINVSISLQIVLIVVASCICQLLRRKPFAELLGKFDIRWLKELGLGGLVGGALMLIPALILGILGWVNWEWNPAGLSALSKGAFLFIGVALAEELLLRGFIFQRLIASRGIFPAYALQQPRNDRQPQSFGEHECIFRIAHVWIRVPSYAKPGDATGFTFYGEQGVSLG